jgi:hypothetical protein
METVQSPVESPPQALAFRRGIYVSSGIGAKHVLSAATNWYRTPRTFQTGPCWKKIIVLPGKKLKLSPWKIRRA